MNPYLEPPAPLNVVEIEAWTAANKASRRAYHLDLETPVGAYTVCKLTPTRGRLTKGMCDAHYRAARRRMGKAS